MSRVGREPISIPGGTQVEVKDGVVSAKGPKGSLNQKILDGMTVKLEDGVLTVSRANDSGPQRAMHGLQRALIANAVQGVTTGFSKQLEVIGVGYRAEVQGDEVNFALGYSHPVVYKIPAGITVEIDKQNRITITGSDRQKLGQVAAEMRNLRRPDPYKGKGIKYSDEVIRRKVGKAGGK